MHVLFVYWTPAIIGEDDRCVRVMGETLVMKRRRLRESVLLERGRVAVVADGVAEVMLPVAS